MKRIVSQLNDPHKPTITCNYDYSEATSQCVSRENLEVFHWGNSEIGEGGSLMVYS